MNRTDGGLGLPTRMTAEVQVVINNLFGLVADLMEGVEKDFVRLERLAPAPPDSEDLLPNPGNPQYGPRGKPTPEQKAFWEEAQREAKEKYPIYSPQSLAEAKHAGVTPEELHLMVAHEMYLEKMRHLAERYEKEEWEREKW